MNDVELQENLIAHFRSAASEIELATDPAHGVAQRVARRRRHRQRRRAMTAAAMVALVVAGVGAAAMRSSTSGLNVTAGGNARIADGQPVFVAARLPPGLEGARPFVLAAPTYVVLNNGGEVRVVAATGDVSSFLREVHGKKVRRATIKGLRGTTYEVAGSVAGMGPVSGGEHLFAFVAKVGAAGLAYVQVASDATAFADALAHETGAFSSVGYWSRLLAEGASRPATTIYSAAAKTAAVPPSVTLLALPTPCASVALGAGAPTSTITVGHEVVPVSRDTFATIDPNHDAQISPGVHFCLARAGVSVTVQILGPSLADSVLTEVAAGIRPATSGERVAMSRDLTVQAALPSVPVVVQEISRH